MRIIAFALIFMTTWYPATSFSSDLDHLRSSIDAKDWVRATELATKLSRQSNPEGDYALAVIALAEKTDAADKKAFSYLYSAAIRGHSRAMVVLGRFFLIGKGTSENFEEGINWLRRGADQGEVDANFYIAFAKWIMAMSGGDPSEIPELTLKVLQTKGHENSVYYVGAAYLLGDAWKRSVSQEQKRVSEFAFGLVLRSQVKDELIESFKKEIVRLSEAGQSQVAKGDGSSADIACQKIGFKVWDEGYPQCKAQAQRAIAQQEQQQAQYELQLRRHQQAVAEYEARLKEAQEERRQQRSLAMMQYGLSLMGGTYPRALDNFERASREMLRLPPAPEPPKLESFTIIGPSGQRSICTSSGTLISCR